MLWTVSSVPVKTLRFRQISAQSLPCGSLEKREEEFLMKLEDYFQQRAHGLVAPILRRLMELVRDRYECEIHYRILEELSSSEKILLCSMDSKATTLKLEAKSLFPISIKGEIVGAAEILQSKELQDLSLKALRRVVSIVIESLHTMSNTAEVMSVLEKQFLPKISKASNVIPMMEYKKTEDITQPDPTIPNEWNVNFHGNTRFNIPCLIESKSMKDIHKMALEVHEHSQRFAFLYYNQLDFNIRTSASELHKLGNVSLFVPNITYLKDEEIFALINFLKSSRTKESPQIIAGSSILIKDILHTKLLPKELIGLLNVAFLRMENSFEIYKKQGLVEYFFDSFHNPHSNIY